MCESEETRSSQFQRELWDLSLLKVWDSFLGGGILVHFLEYHIFQSLFHNSASVGGR